MKEYTEEWYNENEGTEIEIDDNYCECAKWVIGEHRCVCGNRRIYLENIYDDILAPMTD
jgi:hypothetical protein